MDDTFNILPNGWLNSQDIEEFTSTLNEAVSVRSRMKLAIAARRTSKRRSFLRKMRAKRRKSTQQLKIRARRVVRATLKKKLYKGSWQKLSYSQRMRIDAAVNKKKKFINGIVNQIMPKIVKGESERLKRLNEEKSPAEIRIEARRRKQKQRAKEQEVRQLDPARLAMVVRDDKGKILIVDKNSFESEKHTVVIPANDMSYEVALRVSKDENFKNTLTSQRILGDKIKKEKEESNKENKPKTKEESTKSVGEVQQDLGMSSTPVQDTTQINHNMAKWVPFLALNAMKGIDPKNTVKNGGISDEQAKEYAFSDNMKEFGDRVAANFIDSFVKMTGRNINEYDIQILQPEMYKTSDVWKNFALPQDVPITDVVFSHICTKGAKDGSACIGAGLSPEDQYIKFNIKYGSSNLTTGKANNNTKAIFYTVQQKISSLMSGQDRAILGNDITIEDSDKRCLDDINKKLNEYGKFLDTKLKKYEGYSLIPVMSNTSQKDVRNEIEQSLLKIYEIKTETNSKLRDIFGYTRISKKLFLHELLTGSLKFDDSLAASTHMMTVDPDSFDVKLNRSSESYIDQVIDSEMFKFNINFKLDQCGTATEQKAFEKTINDFKAEGIQLPEQLDVMRFCGRETTGKKLKENLFKYSKLSVLFEQEMPIAQAPEMASVNEHFENVYLKNYLNELFLLNKEMNKTIQKYELLMNLFRVDLDSVQANPIDLYDVSDERNSAKFTTMMINGKERNIQLMNIPFFDSDDTKANENPMEAAVFAKRFISERNYGKEYKRYHAKQKQKRNRAKRNAARAKFIRLGRVRKGDGKDVDHKNGDPTDNSTNNLRVRSKSENRADNK